MPVAKDARLFYKQLFVLVGPIALQNLISAAVNSADVLMLNYVGQTALAASSLAGQVSFVLMLFYVGLASGLVMLTAQYWGRGDSYSIETLAGIALKISGAVGLVFAGASFFCPELLMRIFTNEPKLIQTGAEYLKIVSLSFLLMSVSQVYEAVFKSIEKVRIVTAITFITLTLNIILNAVFIFGLFGAPKLGIRGVALATTISRVVEILICIGVSFAVREVKLRPSVLFRKNTVLMRDFVHYSFPAMGNEVVWGLAFSIYSAILGRLGEDIVASNSVVAVVRELASVLCFGMAYGGAILLGKEMGGSNLEHARADASRLWRSVTVAGFLASLVILALRPLVLSMVTLTPTATHYLSLMLIISAVNIFGAAINTGFICGLFRAGGDAKFGLIMDSIAMWGVSIPLGLLAAFVLKLPPVWVYLILSLDEFEKIPFVIWHYRKDTWVKNITRDFDSEEKALE